MVCVRLSGVPIGTALRMVWVIGWADFYLKYRGSVLGYLWSLLGPLSRFVILLYVFGHLFPMDIPHYLPYLLLGVIVWEHFTLLTSSCLSMPIEKEFIIRQVPFPRIILILAVGWTVTIINLTHMLIFFIVAIWDGSFVWTGLLIAPLLLLLLDLFGLSIGMLLSAYSLRYRDVAHLWTIALQVLFWLTPIAYAHAVAAPTWVEAWSLLSGETALTGWEFFKAFTRFQPLSLILFDLRRVFLPPGTWPSLVHFIGMVIVTGILSIFSSRVFNRRSRFFIQEY